MDDSKKKYIKLPPLNIKISISSSYYKKEKVK